MSCHRSGILLGLLAFFVSLAHAWSSLSSSSSPSVTLTPRKSVPTNCAAVSSKRHLCCSRNLPPTRTSNGNICMQMKRDDDEQQQRVNGDNMTPIETTSVRGGGGREQPQKTTTTTGRRYNFSVGAVLAAAFLNLLGFTMAGPITPALGQHFSLQMSSKFGALTSAYPLGMLLGLFLWPPLSDSIGRKPVITISLLGSGLGLAAQSWAIYDNWGLALFLLTRVLTGSFAGASPVSKAFLADVGTAQGKLPRYLALRDAAATLAFIVGPMFGGILFDVQRRTLASSGTAAAAAAATSTSSSSTTSGSLAFVIAVSAAASLAAAALVAMGVKEVPASWQQKSTKQVHSNNTKDTPSTSSSCPLGVSLWAGVATVCCLSFLFNVGDSCFHAFFPSLLKEKLSLDTKAIGLAYTVFACISFAVSATVAGQSIQNNGPVATCAMGLTAVAGGLLALAGLQGSWILAAAALYYSGVPLYGPTIPTMLLQCVPSHKRGAVMGLDGAINTVARVVAPLAMGEVYRRAGSTAAFAMAGVSVLAAAVMALVRRFMVVQRRGNEKDLFVMKQA